MYIPGYSSDYEMPNKGVTDTKDQPKSHETITGTY